MLGVLCARPKSWIFGSISSFVHASTTHHYHYHSRFVQGPIRIFSGYDHNRRHHSSACQLGGSSIAGAASIWHAILPSGDLRRPAIHFELKGEGSWNAAWDARPARWLHSPDSAWLLFGVCACLAPYEWAHSNPYTLVSEVKNDISDSKGLCSDDNIESAANYRVTGVLADGRCLFRAIAHVACLRNGEETPDENRQKELADELRAQVVEELLERREEIEWSIEGDFDEYVKRIKQPYIWGGEHELIMASHVLKTPISVYMVDRRSGGYVNISRYGEEYRKEEETPINVLFHGYGHYDILESLPEQSCKKLQA